MRIQRIPRHLIMLVCCTVFALPKIRGQERPSGEISVRAGGFSILGDVDHAPFSGWATSLGYSSSLNSVVSIRPRVFYGITHGLDASHTTDNIYQEPSIFEGYSETNPWFFAYECRLLRVYLQACFELSNLGPEKKANPFNYYLMLGAGINSYGTWLNLKDLNGNTYSNLLTETKFNTVNDYNTSKGRKAIRKELSFIYDDSYETPAAKQQGKYRLGDETNIDTEVSIGLGFAFQLSQNVSISLEHEYILIPSDYLDGQRWRTYEDATARNDAAQYTSLGISFRLQPKKKSLPLNWVNPWLLNEQWQDSLQLQIDSLQEAIRDFDSDGVINAMDQQPNSIPNCPVDVKGITSDLDRDGISDCYDKFPFINKNEFEMIIDQALEKDRRAFEQLNDKIQSYSSDQSIEKNSNFSFGTIIFFESDSDVIQLSQMEKIAIAMSQISSLNISCITITGHTDPKNESEYNEALGLRRANQVAKAFQEYFDKSVLNIQVLSLGESRPLMIQGPKNVQNAINRRVEISFCE